jgi:hypothetical protein
VNVLCAKDRVTMFTEIMHVVFTKRACVLCASGMFSQLANLAQSEQFIIVGLDMSKHATRALAAQGTVDKSNSRTQRCVTVSMLHVIGVVSACGCVRTADLLASALVAAAWLETVDASHFEHGQFLCARLGAPFTHVSVGAYAMNVVVRTSALSVARRV